VLETEVRTKETLIKALEKKVSDLTTPKENIALQNLRQANEKLIGQMVNMKNFNPTDSLNGNLKNMNNSRISNTQYERLDLI
jgi:hypothetical protein